MFLDQFQIRTTFAGSMQEQEQRPVRSLGSITLRQEQLVSHLGVGRSLVTDWAQRQYRRNLFARFSTHSANPSEKR
jgi:hypothetical protein